MGSLHARAVVTAEGFTAFSARRTRLQTFLSTYRWEGSTADVLDAVATRIQEQVQVVRETASADDPTYERMLTLGRDKDRIECNQDRSPFS